jgi:glutaredoxin
VQAEGYLKSIGVSYKEVDVSKDSPAVTAMWNGVRAQGFNGRMVQTPIVEKDGKYYHEIPDIRKFLSEMVNE